jgi:transposase InsO family protein
VSLIPCAAAAPSFASRVGEHAAQQRLRREQECQARHEAVRFVEEQNSSCRRAALCLRVSSRTLADWKRRKARGELAPRLRGRPCREATPGECVTVETLLDETGPRLGLPTLEACCSDVPRCVLAYLLAGYRRQFQAEHRLVVETLHWRCPGSVWAIDHSMPPRPIDGCYSQILAIRDLASGMQLAWTPVADATAAEALPVLAMLVAQHGPPLVLKSDNGSAFISQRFAEWLAAWQIVPLFSPVRMPRYNGACEAGIGGMKRRTELIAARHDRLLDWTCDDLFAALVWANEDHYPRGLAAGTAAGRFAARPTLGEAERNTFRATVVQFEQELYAAACISGDVLTDKLRAVYHRRAVRRVLVEHDYLSTTRRSIPQPIQSAKCARIT